MQHRPLVFLDIETTGMSPTTGGRITEIGALRVENGKVVGTFSQLINPEQHVPSFISKMTGISDDMLWEAPLFKSIAADLELFLDDAIFIAHNVNFDYSFIKAAFVEMGSKFTMDRLCTARLSRRLYPDQPRHNLDTIIARHGFVVADRHRAFDDAKVLWEFWQRALEDHGLEAYRAMDHLLVKTRQAAS
ncbi:MAG TPA: 3'-5' exonuclease [Candidatus Microsaccharimonas sp.]|nr:3'-5' exonuclease [Candidatus Microsaccharimonas sp.]